MVEREEEQPAFEIAVVVPKRSNVKEEDESSECVEVLVHDFQNVGLLVERVLGVADQFIKVSPFKFLSFPFLLCYFLVKDFIKYSFF